MKRIKKWGVQIYKLNGVRKTSKDIRKVLDENRFKETWGDRYCIPREPREQDDRGG